MPKNLSIHVKKTRQTDDLKWNIAIEEVNSEISRLRLRLDQLRLAVRIFEANRKDGVSWPEIKEI